MLERRTVDLNQKHRIIKLWVSIIGIVLVLMGLVATGAVKMNQVGENKEDIEVIEVKQEEQKEILIRIDERTAGMKEDIDEIKRKIE